MSEDPKIKIGVLKGTGKLRGPFARKVLLGEGFKEPQWQPIDTAPEKVFVLVCEGDEVFEAIKSGVTWIGTCGTVNPTHWQPKPRPFK